MKYRIINRKIRTTVLLPLLFLASQSAHAITYYYNSCPTGTTGAFVDYGIITGGGSGYSVTAGSPIYGCTSSNSNDTTTTNTSQIQRATSNTLNYHLMDKVVREFVSEDKINKVGASADSSDYKPDGVWGETNLSSLTNHSNNVPGFSNNIYQFTGGLDKRQGDLFYGAALAYAYTDINQIGNSTMHTVGITPYAAYKINDYLFATGLASYYYSNTSASLGAGNTDTHDYLGEANINTFKVINSFTLKGRGAYDINIPSPIKKVAPMLLLMKSPVSLMLRLIINLIMD